MVTELLSIEVFRFFTSCHKGTDKSALFHMFVFYGLMVSDLLSLV